jgi:hypothetical protein
MENVNYIALLVASIASMVVGYVWYGPLFGKEWTKLMGWSSKDVEEAKKGAAKSYAGMYVLSLITAYVLSLFLSYAGALTITDALMVGFWAWLGFTATVIAGGVLFERRPMKFFLLNAGFQLANILVMAAVLVSFGLGY